MKSVFSMSSGGAVLRPGRRGWLSMGLEAHKREEGIMSRTIPSQPGAPAPVADEGNPRRWAIMAVLGAVAFMAQLDFFIVNVALDGIGRSFPGSPESLVSWVLSAYAIVFAGSVRPPRGAAGPFR